VETLMVDSSRSQVAERPEAVDTVVIGAGQAGLSMSWTLTRSGREHIVLDARDRLGGGWLKRWDSFTLVTPNWSAQLPGYAYAGPDPDAFMPRDDLVAYVAGYARSFDAPVRLGAHVSAVDLAPGGGLLVETDGGAFLAQNVIVATGAFQAPRIPALAAGLPAGIVQVHTDAYRNEAELPPGAVLVVGAGQSGCQVAEELHQAGRRVFLSVSSCWSAPRRYRGRDVFWWIAQMALRGAERGMLPPTVDDLPDPRARFACNPQLSGKDGGHSIELRRLGADGMTLLGHLDGASDGRISLADDLDTNLRHADTFFDEKLRPDIDAFIDAASIDAPEDDRARIQFDPPRVASVDLRAEDISAVVWATGYRLDLGWVRPVSFDAMGYPIHRRGVTEVPGLYFLGLPWLHTQTSSLLIGVGRDAAYLGEVIEKTAGA
jgi:putative flavoprotein involved in K+ transport